MVDAFAQTSVGKGSPRGCPWPSCASAPHARPLLEFADVDEQIEMECDPVVHFNEAEHGFGRVYSESAHLKRLFAAQLETARADFACLSGKRLFLGAGADGNFHPRLHIEPVLAVAVEALGVLAGIDERDADMGILIGLQGFLHVVVNLPVVAIETFDRDGEVHIFEAGVSAISVNFERLFLVLLVAIAGK